MNDNYTHAPLSLPQYFSLQMHSPDTSQTAASSSSSDSESATFVEQPTFANKHLARLVPRSMAIADCVCPAKEQNFHDKILTIFSQRNYNLARLVPGSMVMADCMCQQVHDENLITQFDQFVTTLLPASFDYSLNTALHNRGSTNLVQMHP
jgi:hypothetical protein